MALVGTVSGLIQSAISSQSTDLVHLLDFDGAIVNSTADAILKAGLDSAVPYAIQIPVAPLEIYDGLHAMAIWDVLDKSLFDPALPPLYR